MRHNLMRMVDSNDPDLIKKLQNQFKLLKIEKNLINQNIKPWLDKAKEYIGSQNERKQKIKEIIDLGHFLHHLNEKVTIEETYTESPDFIVKSNENLIGIELKDFITNEYEKEKEGQLKSIFKKVIQNLEEDIDRYKGSYRVEFQEEKFSLKRSNRELIEKEIISIIKGANKKSEVIKNITKLQYDGIAIHKGETTTVGNINKEMVQKKINSKEKLLHLYKEKNLDQIWLVLIIGGVEKSSDFSHFDTAIKKDNFKSNFDRVFIYEFFDRNITELKITSQNNVS